MGLRKKQDSFDSRRYKKRATKRRATFRPPAHPLRILLIVLSAVAVVILALVWGSYLKKQSDAYRADKEAGAWTLDTEVATPVPTELPDRRAIAISPGGNTGDILIAGKHQGILLPLMGADGVPLFRSAVAAEAGMTQPAELYDLPAEVTRITRRGLHLTCIFPVTSLSEEDTATAVYRRGLELALLREFAAAGMQDILLVGLPAGSEEADRRSVAFIEELSTLLSELEEPPRLGVALPLSAFASEAGDGEELIYAGNLTPGRFHRVAAYLAMDLRGQTPDTLSTLLPELSYAYVRHGLCLLTTTEAANVALEHGFLRVWEMDAAE